MGLARHVGWPLAAAASILFAALAAGLAGAERGRRAAANPSFAVLVYTRTTGYRHASIEAGVAALEALGAEHGFVVTHTEDPAAFDDAGLGAYKAVVFLNTSGDVLGPPQRAAFERYIRAGGGFVGVHSATDTEYGWPWYGGLVGAYFANHPAIQPAELTVVAEHPSTVGLPRRWPRTDEWYNFRAPLPADVQVLVTIDESTYTGGTMGAPHPISWAHSYDGGRAWYTALGHTEEAFADQTFRAHLLGGLRWAAGVEPPARGERGFLPSVGG